jgi:hypothetical protein
MQTHATNMGTTEGVGPGAKGLIQGTTIKIKAISDTA